jgi:hypothetical protein
MRLGSVCRPILISAAAIMVALAASPAASQMVVYDPSNYAQNVLQAARALQQINNQATSLQNQTRMLLNQARNLTNLPYSLAAGHRSVDPAYAATAQSSPAPRLRHQPHRSGLPAFLSAELSGFDLLAAARRRRADALAEFARRLPGRAAGPGRRGAGT